MAKAKAVKKPGTAASAPQCTCDDPFTCSCGNRPPRPSKGHKWDSATQAWGGKGHKQKGASGQIALVAVEATTTSVGKTTVAQWQRLPSQLLDEVCNKEGRPPPKYESVASSASKQMYRVIVQDQKVAKRGTDHDLIFVPASSCDNEEQAKEEAALLALLHLTPKIPHERKLPEPYKTTWLNAVDVSALKQNKAKDVESVPQKQNSQPPGSEPNGGAKASSNLTLGRTYVSHADKQRQHDVARKQRNARIQKHEAFRMANRDHQVFLSAKCRKQIETLLRGDTVNLQDLLLDDRDDTDEDDDDDLKTYVVQRLHSEGFTNSQARTAFNQLKEPPTALEEQQWDAVYDECLQWLCIHLDEDQLPEGFDPRGRTLDIVVPLSKMTRREATQADGSGVTANERSLANKYGITEHEAALVLSKTSPTESEESILWRTFCLASSTCLENETSDDCQRQLEASQEECGALQAIFSPEECHIQQHDDNTTVTFTITTENGNMYILEVVVRNGMYPSRYPERVLLSGPWDFNSKLGTSVHIEMVRFLSTLPLGDPMMYEIYGHATTLLHSAEHGELESVSLLSAIEGRPSERERDQVPFRIQDHPPNVSNGISSKSMPQKIRRPRERHFFWCKSAKETPPATPFPKIGTLLEQARKGLPAMKARDEFLSMMRKADEGGRVVLVTGDTGCGKTTQIPQFILEEYPANAKIVVAQPRRLAATGVAARVANERGEKDPGNGSVGYVVRGDTAMCKSTRLLFCTTGVLLRQLQSDGALDSITHVIVDEVHERHLDTDVLLGVLKECLKTTPHLRVVLMSATLDADRFAGYWGSGTPRLHIPGRTFPVADFMLEDVLALTAYVPPKNGKQRNGGGKRQIRKATPWADSEKSDDEGDELMSIDKRNADANKVSTGGTSRQIPLEELMKRVDQTSVDYDLLGHLVRHLVQNKDGNDDGSILVFLPGAPEINKAIETIRKTCTGLSLHILPLHGGLQPKEQNLVFQTTSHGWTKVILSTNVAETSITIPDCTIVIDSCREKQSSYDPGNRMPLLVEHFAAKASLMQRRGRAGRVRAGTCYKLISNDTYSRLQEHSEPEIRRCALDQTLLSLLFLGVENGSGNFLRTLLDPPSRESVNAALSSLQKLGAITPIRGEDGSISLTPLGMHLAGIPAPPTVGKILVMGSILGCRSAALAMAAAMSSGRSPFMRIDNNTRKVQEESVDDTKRRNILEERDILFKSVGNSDLAMLAAVYLKWDQVDAAAGERKRYCESLGLSFNGMRDMKQLVHQLDSSLSASGYVSSLEANRNGRSWRIIRACAVAALAPSQMVRVQRPSTKYSETAEGAIEKDGLARELQFYIRRGESNDLNQQDPVLGNQRNLGVVEENVFLHPSSANFAVGSYNCPWLVYHELVRTSKAFLRDATECSAYALLIFGGKLEVQASKDLIVIDDWVRLAANARIGALIGGLRRKVDDLLSKKVEDPTFDIAGTLEMRLIVSLLVNDGLGQ